MKRARPWFIMLAVVTGIFLLAAAAGAQAPDRRALVYEMAAAPGSVIKNDPTAFTDQVCRALAAEDPRWGRKVREAGLWNSRNVDAVAYQLGDSHVYVDVVASAEGPGANPSPAWIPSARSDGYWMACAAAPPPDPGPEPGPDPPPGPTLPVLLERIEARLAAIEAALGTQLPSKPVSYDLFLSVPFLGTARGSAVPKQ